MFDDVEGKYTVGTENTINMTVFLKGEKKYFSEFQVLVSMINGLKFFILIKLETKNM